MKTLIQAKKEGRSLYRINFEDNSAAIFLSLKWGEFKSYRDLLNQIPKIEDDLIDRIVEDCLLVYLSPLMIYDKGEEPQDTFNGPVEVDFGTLYNVIPYGVFDTIFHMIWLASGADSQEKLFQDIESYRSIAPRLLEERIISNISLFNKNRNKDYDNMEWDDVLSIISQSELLMTEGAIQGEFRPAGGNEQEIDFDSDNKKIRNS